MRVGQMKTLRAIGFWWQRRTRGWDDSDTWSLDVTIAEFVLPRLRRLKELNDGYPCKLDDFDDEKGMKEWNEKLDAMIEAFEIACTEDWSFLEGERAEKFNHGFDLFAKHYRELWW